MTLVTKKVLVPEGTNPIIRSVVLNTLVEFNLSTLYEIIELPNEGDHYFLTVHD